MSEGRDDVGSRDDVTHPSPVCPDRVGLERTSLTHLVNSNRRPEALLLPTTDRKRLGVSRREDLYESDLSSNMLTSSVCDRRGPQASSRSVRGLGGLVTKREAAGSGVRRDGVFPVPERKQ